MSRRSRASRKSGRSGEPPSISSTPMSAMRAGERILAGQIRRGDTQSIHAAIWLSDMRGFTVLADNMAPHALIALLNRFFDCQVPPILAHGGEVLKFMGDGLLGIFPIADEAEAGKVCVRALSAAREAQAAITAMNEEGGYGHQAKSASAWPCTSAKLSTAISAGEGGSISPASAPR